MIQTISAQQLFENMPSAVCIDVRTPLEYAQGHIPNAINIPLLSNEERVIIGTTYKQIGRHPAILKGFELVGGRWADFIREAEEKSPNKKVVVHCWRGGMRSGAMAWVLDLYGFDVKVLKGGYKAFRNEVIAGFNRTYPLQILSGKTGSGKTLILHELRNRGEQVIDLEGLVKHQGSSFGSKGKEEQPTQEQFENDLFYALQSMDNQQPIWVESESVVIGKRVIPKAIFQQMLNAPVVDLALPIDERVAFLVEDYGHLDKSFLERALLGIAKRLGPEQTKNALLALAENRMDDFMRWALQYYDKQYQKSLDRRNKDLITYICLNRIDPAQNAEQILLSLQQTK